MDRAVHAEAPLRDLEDTEVGAFRRDGVLLARGVLPAPWLDEIDAALEYAAANPTPIATTFSDPKQGFHMEVGLFRTDPRIEAVVRQSPLARIAQRVMGSQRVHFFYDQMFCKQPGNQTATPWHHDLTFWPVEGEQICSTWIPMRRSPLSPR